jgi:AcrR family transcriptional regulator
MNELTTIDRRRQRTRDAIRKAFIDLAIHRWYHEFSTAELIATANIGKSTFYEHYRSKDDVLRSLMEGMLGELARAATGQLDPARLRFLVAHFWDNRRLGKSVFGPPLVQAIRRRLAELIEETLCEQPGLTGRTRRATSLYMAAGQIGLLNAWLSGELSVDLDDVVAALAGEAHPSIS